MKIKKMNVLKFSALPLFLGYGWLNTMNLAFSLMIFCGFVAITTFQFMYITDQEKLKCTQQSKIRKGI